MNSDNAYHDKEDSLFLLHQGIIESCRGIRRFKLDDFSTELGDYQLNQAKGFADELQAIANVINQTTYIESLPQKEILKLPKPTLKALKLGLENMESILREMREFFELSEINNPSLLAEELSVLRVRRDGLANHFYNLYQKLQESFNFSQLLYLSNELVGAKNDIQRLSDEDVKEGIGVHDKLYRRQASNHFEAGFFWLFVGSSSLFFSYLYGSGSISEIEKFAQSINGKTSFSTEALISIASVRVFIFSLLTTFSFWSFRNYRLNKHNELLNRQKELALATFTEFSNAAVGDIEMRRVLLGKVAATIFDPQHLGYIPTERGGLEDSIGILNAADLLSRMRHSNNSN